MSAFIQTTAAPPKKLQPFLSEKLSFWSLAAMLCLVYVHAFNLHPHYLLPWTQVKEPFTVGNGLQYLLSNGVLRFRIPILFTISGYLLAWRGEAVPHRQRVQRRLRTLGLPYLMWSLIWLVLLGALELLPALRPALANAQLSPFGAHQLVSQYTPAELLERWLLTPVPFQLWFLRSLLVYNIMYPWLKYAVLQRPVLYFGFAGFFWFTTLAMPFFLEGEGLLFFGLGIWLAYHNYEVQVAPRWFHLGLSTALWLGAAALKTWLAYRTVEYHWPLKLTMLTLYKVGEVSGMLTAWFGLDALVRRAMARHWFSWLTGFSFMIYVLHVPLVNYLTELALYYGRGLPQLYALTYLLAPLLTIALCVAAAAALRRVAPGTYAVLTGGRGPAAS